MTDNAGDPMIATYVVAVDNPIPATGNGILNNVVTGGSPGSNCPRARRFADVQPDRRLHDHEDRSTGTGTGRGRVDADLHAEHHEHGTVALPAVTVTDDLSDVLDDATFGDEHSRRDPQREHADWTGPLPVSATPVVVTYTVVVNTRR